MMEKETKSIEKTKIARYCLLQILIRVISPCQSHQRKKEEIQEPASGMRRPPYTLSTGLRQPWENTTNWTL